MAQQIFVTKQNGIEREGAIKERRQEGSTSRFNKRANSF
jgi:hypothetical protein